MDDESMGIFLKKCAIPTGITYCGNVFNSVISFIIQSHRQPMAPSTQLWANGRNIDYFNMVKHLKAS